MKKILSVALSTAMAFSMFANVAFGDTAALTPQDKFNALAAKGILNGYPDGQAHLEKDLTRAEFAKIVTKLFDLKEVNNKLSYKDKGYNANMWAVKYIEAVTEAGLMQGQDTVKGIFNYNGKVTVEEVAAVLVRALKLEVPTSTDNNASAWAKGYAQAVIDAGLGITKDTNFKANATRSLVVETAYAVDVMKTAPVVVSAEALSPTSVLVTFADKTTTTVPLTTALVQDQETVISFEYKGFKLTAKVTLTAPKVVSVTTPNSKQLVVKFNQPLKADTIKATDGTVVDGNLTVTKLGDATTATINGAAVALSEGDTVATITLPGNEYFKGQYTFTVTDAVKTATGTKVTPYTTILTVADVAAPTVVSTSSVAKATTNKVTVKFSEPVQLAGVIAYVDGVAATPARGDGLDELVLTTSTTLVTGKTYNISFLNVQDFAGNFISPNPTTSTVTVTADVELPTIASFTVSGEGTVKVVFNKAVDINSLHGIFTLLDSNGVSKGAMTPTAGSDNKTFTLTALPGSITYTNNVFNGTVVVKAGIRDLLGNVSTATSTQAVTFTKDTTPPTVVSATYTSTGLAVKFSENVNVTGNKFTLINNSTGVSKEVTVASNTYTNKDGLVTFTNVTGFASGNYTLRLPAAFVKDTSAQANPNAAVSQTVAITATSATDTTKPTVSNVVVLPAEGGDQVIQYTIQDASGINLSTVMDINNYTLDAKALPAGSFVVTNYAGVQSAPVNVKVYIPSSGISVSKGYAFMVTGVQDNAGNVITPYVAPSVALVDGVAPTLNTVAISADDSTRLVLTFSEAVNGVNASQFTVKVNGVEVKLVNVSGTGSKYFANIAVSHGTYNGASVLWSDVNNDSTIQAGEIIAYTADNAANLDLSAVYVNGIEVTVKDTATITDGSSNKITPTTVNK